jgi:hypothetical protein
MAVVRTPTRIQGLGLLACVLAVAACATTPSPPPTVAPTSSLVPPLGGQTETEWGVIWDTIPADFPVYEGAVPSEESASGPVSANLVVEGVDPSAVATWTDSALSNAGYTITEGQESMEDGSIALEAVRGPDCHVRVTSAPLGSLTSVAILYGASCPQP